MFATLSDIRPVDKVRAVRPVSSFPFATSLWSLSAFDRAVPNKPNQDARSNTEENQAMFKCPGQGSVGTDEDYPQ